MNDFRWLHLSDFHVGKDTYAQIKLFEYILNHIVENREKGYIPDAIFITGDIANKGLQEEYVLFAREFLLPLQKIQGSTSNVYIVPGNHDLDRTQCELAAEALYGILGGKQNHFFYADSDGLRKRKEIFGRFEPFRNAYKDGLCFSVENIFNEKGYFSDTISKGDKTIGVIGLNTAWLSNSDRDKEKLSPGKYILEEALGIVKDCDYKVVLGHHPLSWLESGQKSQITALLAKNKALYLHGHMHKNSGECAMALNTGFLTLQSGAAFQAREDEIYCNSFQWGELLFEENMTRVRPKRWSAMNQKFIADTPESLSDDFKEEGVDCWLFPCTFSITNKKATKNSISKPTVPTGWCLVDKKFIEKRKKPAKEDILKYFDGKEPSYNDIFSSYIPERTIVSEIATEFVRCNADRKIKAMLVTGAGGEGKTTVLLQVVRRLVEKANWNALVLRQADKDMVWLEEQLLKVTQEGTWVICIDNCFTISDKIFELLKKLKIRGVQSVHFLLCARDTDWNNSDSNKLQWSEYADYELRKLRGIIPEDAERIVSAWGEFGETGLGKLKDLDLRDAAEKLLLSSKDEEKKNEMQEGALLGAMLSTRYGDELHNHVRDMLLRLQEVSLQEGTLLDAFAYIVAMHSEQLYYLSKTVLAQLYNIEVRDVKRFVLGPLGDEAASAVSGEMIYTRHISIARSARKILDKEYHYDFDEIFIKLATAAMEAKQKGEFVDNLACWKYLSERFFETNKTLAIRLDKAILNIDQQDAYMIVHLSKLYRKAGQAELGLDLFRNVNYKTDHRPFFAEWALEEANSGNKAASVCLSALALSDQVSAKYVDVKNACINLYSIAQTFLELYTMYNQQIYLSAAQAAVMMGELIEKDNYNIKKLIEARPELRASKSVKLTKNLTNDLRIALSEGILLAEKQREIRFKDWVPDVASLEYEHLFRLC